VTRGRDDLYAKRIDMPCVEWHVHSGMLTDACDLGRRRVQRHPEPGGQRRQHRPGLVLVGEVLVGHSAQRGDRVELRVGCGAVEQDIATGPRPQVGVRGQSRDGGVGAGLVEVGADAPQFSVHATQCRT
jgi:hypothetical protein